MTAFGSNPFGFSAGNPFGFPPTFPPLVKHKVFISYHHGGDQHYHDAFTRQFHDTYESIYDNSLERRIDSDNVDYVRRRIREDFIKGTSCAIVLVGAQTFQRKYVDWEIDATLDMGHALIGVQLPTLPVMNNRVMVPWRLSDNIDSGYALWEAWQHITVSHTRLDLSIATAKLKSGPLIRNGRARMVRNA